MPGIGTILAPMLRLLAIVLFSLVFAMMPALGFAATADADGCQSALSLQAKAHDTPQAHDDCLQHQHKKSAPCSMDGHCASPTCQTMIVELVADIGATPKVPLVFELMQAAAPPGQRSAPPEEPPRVLV